MYTNASDLISPYSGMDRYDCPDEMSDIESSVHMQPSNFTFDVASDIYTSTSEPAISQAPSSPMSKSSLAASKLIKTRRDNKSRSGHPPKSPASNLRSPTTAASPRNSNVSIGYKGGGANNNSNNNGSVFIDDDDNDQGDDDCSIASGSSHDTRPTSTKNFNKARTPVSIATPAINHHQSPQVQTTPTSSSAQGASLDDTMRFSNVQHAASPTALRSLRRLRASRKRVPGGAAAKLVGKASLDSMDQHFASNYDDVPTVEAPTAELESLREKAKSEFSVGTDKNRRYHTPTKLRNNEPPEITRAYSEASAPSIFNRSDVFHDTATAAVLSLLAPRTRNAGGDGQSIVSSRSNLEDPMHAPMPSPTVSAFRTPKRNIDDASTVISTTGSCILEDSYDRHSAKNPIDKPLLSPKAQKKVEEMEKSMKDPNKTLSDLLAAIASTTQEEMGRGYMVRRKNACGALQVLTAKNVHRIQICWTVGVLPAIASVLEDAGEEGLEVAFPDLPTRKEYIEARKRAISSLMNLCVPKENRLAVFHSPNLIPLVVRVIEEDEDESRRGCCAVLACLAKTVENRLLMVQVPGLIDAVTAVIRPKPLHRIPPRTSGTTSGTNDSSKTERWEQKGGKWDGYPSDDQSCITGNNDNDHPTKVNHSISTSGASAGAPEMVDRVPYDEEEKEEAQSNNPLTEAEAKRMAAQYDGDSNEFLHGARKNVFAFLGHLVKEKDNAYHLARHIGLTNTLVKISHLHDSPSHLLSVKLLANLTRHRGNSKVIVFRLRNVVPAFVRATYSQTGEARKYACYGLQNLAQDKPCRQELAVTPGLLTALCVRARQSESTEERLSSIQTLKNLTDEPANLIPMTNTPECFATLMQIAHAGDETVTEMMQYLACDALATLSHWFRSIATSGKRMECIKQKTPPPKELFVPSLKIVTWEQWR